MQIFTRKLLRSFSSNSLVIEFDDLKSGKNLEELIEKAYGPKGLGILFVNNVPEFVELRRATLPLFSKIPKLPPQTLNKYKRPQIFHSLGWSHGVEQFAGKYDTAKGSYYMNCKSDTPEPISPENEKFYTPQQQHIARASNIWIKEIPQIEKNVKALSAKMMKVGALLAKQIDSVAQKNVKNYKKDQLYKVITEGRNHIGRILHYFPSETKTSNDDWCGWHNDHGSLTALTPAMYVDENGNQTTIKTTTGGLFAKNRFGEMTRVAIPQNMMAFQLGECMQIATGGYLEATPHCVVTSDQLAGKNIARNTFALFMEPNHLEVLKVPEGADPKQVAERKAHKIPQLKDRWTDGVFFKDFHKKTIEFYS